jgi:hypothetical protein
VLSDIVFDVALDETPCPDDRTISNLFKQWPAINQIDLGAPIAPIVIYKPSDNKSEDIEDSFPLLSSLFKRVQTRYRCGPYRNRLLFLDRKKHGYLHKEAATRF